ncbi:MAG: TIGR00159 family protein [Myxococcales bacterium]|nr:TIGR00159 family protein [Myxococcales bacterium]MCB9642456.1 TIGR00159 family protein [Myxococcales bacterium]
MKEWLQQIISNLGLTLSWPDRFFWVALIDILLVYYLVYRGLLLLKGTKAVRMLLGLLLAVVSYFLARQFGMQTFSFILDQFFNSFFLVLLIIFQDDLRRGLSRVGINIFTRGARLSDEEMAGLDEMVKAASVLSTKKVGALMVIERDADIRDYIQEGTPLDAVISEELLFSLFLPYSPLHDGAAVLHQGRIVRAGCFLPLTQNPEISKHLGTRHRAAIGLTESTDALVVVVSETDGKISLCRDGKISRGLDPSALYNEVLSALWPRAPQLTEARSTPIEVKTEEKKNNSRPPAEAPKVPTTTRVESIKPAASASPATTSNNSNTRLKPFKPKQDGKKTFQSEIRTTTSDSGKHTDTRLKPLMITETTWSARSEEKKNASESSPARLDEIKRPEESPVPRQEERTSEKSERPAETRSPAAPKEIVVKRIELEDPAEASTVEEPPKSADKADSSEKNVSEKKSESAAKKDNVASTEAQAKKADEAKPSEKKEEAKVSENTEDAEKSSKPLGSGDAPTEILGVIPERVEVKMDLEADLPRSPYSSAANANVNPTDNRSSTEKEDEPSQDPTSPA